MNVHDKYNSYGKPIDFTPDDIGLGDEVNYMDTRFDVNTKRMYHVELYGIWDGEKVEFGDDEKTVVRTTQWLTKMVHDWY